MAQTPINFSDTTPIAPGTDVNVKFQTDSSGNLSAHVPASGTFLFSGLPALTGFQSQNIAIVLLAAGDNDVFTVPVGKRGIVQGIAYNTSASTVTIFPEVKTGGVYYRCNTSTAVATLTNATLNWNGLLLEAGETFSINSSAVGVHIFLVAIIFDNTNPWKAAKITAFVVGDNTIYTAPAGKTGYIASPIGLGVFTAGSAVGATELVNLSGGTLSYIWHLVPSGGSPGAGNVIANSNAIVTNALTGIGVGAFSLGPGDFLSVNTTSNGKQIAWITVYEM